MTNTDFEKFCRLGLAVVETEAQAVASLKERIDKNFANACSYLLTCIGRIVVIGMGKSGHIGRKISATLASTGSPAFFVHPGEASHGDMGMVTKRDAVIAISHSGETKEVLTILPLIKRLGIPLISLTGNLNSTLAKKSDVVLDTSIHKEACPLGLAPTSSTTVTLVMGDALSIALLEARGFTKDDFARSHPGGSLGRRLLLHVGDVMRTDDAIPQVSEAASLKQALMEMTEKGLGITAAVDASGKIKGVFTDGDLRRTLEQGIPILGTSLKEVMTKDCKTLPADRLAAEAVQMMEKHKITALLVVDDNDHVIGALNMHDLLRAGVL